MGVFKNIKAERYLRNWQTQDMGLKIYQLTKEPPSVASDVVAEWDAFSKQCFNRLSCIETAEVKKPVFCSVYHYLIGSGRGANGLVSYVLLVD